MINAMFEQFGYKSARDLLLELSRDIRDGGDLLAVNAPARTNIKQFGYLYDGGYWLITYRNGRVVSLDYLDTWEELSRLMWGV